MRAMIRSGLIALAAVLPGGTAGAQSTGPAGWHFQPSESDPGQYDLFVRSARDGRVRLHFACTPRVEVVVNFFRPPWRAAPPPARRHVFGFAQGGDRIVYRARSPDPDGVGVGIGIEDRVWQRILSADGSPPVSDTRPVAVLWGDLRMPVPSRGFAPALTRFKRACGIASG